MRWIDGRITTQNIISETFLPPLACLIVPLALATFLCRPGSVMLSREVQPLVTMTSHQNTQSDGPLPLILLILGIGVLLMVPVFKALTGLPPYIGIVCGLGIFLVL